GVRSPLLIRWPGQIPAGKRIPQIAAAMDLLPTLAELANIPVASRKPLDGVSLKPLLLGTTRDWPDRKMFSHWAGRASVRTRQSRLDNANQLFDMQADPGQTKDIAPQQPETAARLAKAVAQWKQELLPGLKDDRRPFPVGYPAFPITQLPARDGVP